jgi:hypothetical protein
MALEEWPLILAALFAIVWSIVRACLQSVTVDEADTYFWFVAKSEVFYPFPNNHVLSTLLIWIATHIFGLSSFTLRLPALLASILYIGTCHFLCRSIAEKLSLRFGLFICLVYNPFILDFMVAARGYGLANAFLLAVIAVPVWHHVNGYPSLRLCCTLASVALGLSFAANFSFAFVGVASFLVLVTWAIRQRADESITGIVEFCALPGLVVALLVCGYPLTHLKKGDLYYGAQSLSQMTQSLIEATLYHLNPRFGGSLYKIMRFLHPLLLPALGVLCLCQLIAIKFDGSWFQKVSTLYSVSDRTISRSTNSANSAGISRRFTPCWRG